MAIVREDFIGQVRVFLRDQAEFNALLDGQETGDSLIGLAADLAADDWNATPPFVGEVTVETHPSRYILFLGTLIQVLRSSGILQSRNNLNYSDGGLTVATSDKAPQYMAWINQWMNEYERKKRSNKISRNAGSAYGGISSEYMFIGAYGQFLGLSNLDSYTSIRYGFHLS